NVHVTALGFRVVRQAHDVAFLPIKGARYAMAKSAHVHDPDAVMMLTSSLPHSAFPYCKHLTTPLTFSAWVNGLRIMLRVLRSCPSPRLYVLREATPTCRGHFHCRIARFFSAARAGIDFIRPAHHESKPLFPFPPCQVLRTTYRNDSMCECSS
ncbi:hypothetical protein EI94DRAFT_1714250, partial [Lactarius quietus]